MTPTGNQSNFTGRRDIFGFLEEGMDQTPRELPEFYARTEERRIGKCAVYWGCHGCNQPHGHTADRERTKLDHRCACGAHPDYGSFLWGSGMTPWEIQDWRMLAGVEEEKTAAFNAVRHKPAPRQQGTGKTLGKNRKPKRSKEDA